MGYVFIEVLIMARHHECTKEMIELASDYAENYKDYGDTVPTIAGLSCEAGKHRETLMNWANSGGSDTCEDANLIQFFDIYNKIMAAQERRLVNGGLDGGFNPAVTKMILTKHGYSDKQEIDLHATADVTPWADIGTGDDE